MSLRLRRDENSLRFPYTRDKDILPEYLLGFFEVGGKLVGGLWETRKVSFVCTHRWLTGKPAWLVPQYFNIGYGDKLRIDLEKRLSSSLSLPLSLTPAPPSPPARAEQPFGSRRHENLPLRAAGVHVNGRGRIITLNDTRREHVTSALRAIPGR